MYKIIDFYLQGKKYSIFVHRIIWIDKHGIIPYGLELNHRDRNRSNNMVSNLEVITHYQNARHAINVLGKNNQGENNPRAKLKENDIIKIRKHYKIGYLTMTEIGCLFNISYFHVYDIVHRRSWSP